MTSRERFQKTMRHQSPDRIPLDLASTSLTAMSPGCQKKLKDFLGFAGPGTAGHAGVDDRILEWAGTDFRSVGGIMDLPSPHTQRVSDTCFVDAWGVERSIIGPYCEITRNPLRDATLKDLQQFRWPEPRIDEKWLASCEQRAKALCEEDRFVVIGEHPVFGILELGCWMCGYDDFLGRMAGDVGFVHAFFDKVLEIQLALIEQYYSVLGPYIDLTMSGDDFGMQTSPLISPSTFEELILPAFSARIQRTKDLAGCFYWHHSCGSVLALLDLLIRAGVDILNPVQTSAAGMDPARLKSVAGDRMVFWGAMDVQQFLPHATPDEVRKHARMLLDVLGKDGGYVMAPAHNMQDDIPAENIVAWVESLRS